MLKVLEGQFTLIKIKKGTIVQLNDLNFLRPNIGLDTRDYKKILGKKLKKKFYKKSKDLNLNFICASFINYNV